ncbi:hydrolethalus syndrome protein 1 [Rhincodon typus]|uniref:hydrolethalus syndrome protein 1 n=1 Tax=Rhincodon typus TaxID=259920 RepID=UPI00202DC964|nr:hydrolethalus syndrome protein 1 [Rhincodon typus]
MWEKCINNLFFNSCILSQLQSSHRSGIGTFYGHPNEFHHCDAYSRFSVASNPFRCTSAPTRLILQNIPNQESYDSPAQSEISTSSPEVPCESKRKPVIRRKVLRKKNGQMHVCDESVISETDSDEVSELGQRFSKFQTFSNEAESDTQTEELGNRPGSITGGRPNSAHSFFTRDLCNCRPGGSEGYGSVSNQPKSFIRPLMDHPHTRNIKKSDPVAK